MLWRIRWNLDATLSQRWQEMFGLDFHINWYGKIVLFAQIFSGKQYTEQLEMTTTKKSMHKEKERAQT